MMIKTTIALLLAVLAQAGFAETGKPNLVVILADDLGYADVGFNGCKDIPTPHIDSIVQNGVRCTKGYVSYPVCGPSRAGLLTGRHQGRFGFRTNPTIDPENKKAGLPFEEKNIAEVLGQVGYKSTIIGKYHMGTHPSQHPLKRGFTEFYGFLSGGHDYFPENLTLNDLSDVTQQWDWYRTKIMHNHERVEIDEYLTDELSNEAVTFVEKYKDEPFFLYLAYNAPHGPLQATEKYLKRFDYIKDKKRKTYAAMVSALDDGVGRLLAKLRELDIEKDTLVFFLSDNGGPESKNASDNGPLREGKGSIYDGGNRVPFAVQWTGMLPRGTTFEHPVSSLDIMGTIAALAKAPLSPERPLDGVNLIPYLKGEVNEAPHEVLFWNHAHNNSFSILQEDMKLLQNNKEKNAGMELYNLSDDPGENASVLRRHPEKVETLHAKYLEWKKNLKPLAFPSLSEKWWKK